jgi:hypothetical protein
MKSESREKDIVDFREMVGRDFKFYIIESSREYVAEMPGVIGR